MKISEMSTERAFECMARMAPHVAQIIGDEKIVEQRDKLLKKNNRITNAEFMQAICPLMLKEHNDALCAIVAALSDKTADEVKAQPWSETFEEIKDGFTRELFDFFPFAVRLVLSA